ETIRGRLRPERTCRSRLFVVCSAQTIRSSAPAVDDETHAASPGPVRWSQTTNPKRRDADPTTPATGRTRSLRLFRLFPVRKRLRPQHSPVSSDTSRAGNSTTRYQKTRALAHRHA